MPTYSWANMLRYTHDSDVIIGLIKAFIYGGIIALIGCYKGLTCGLGAEGVGHATTEAVVYSSITILIANFFLTLVLGKIAGAVMIEVRNLRKSFGALPVLDGVSFRIENGESVAIIGRSGCGKSVLLKHLIGLLQPETGEVLIDGENIVPMNERQLLRVRLKFGMVFQGSALFDSMTVAENVGVRASGATRIWTKAESPDASPARWKSWICRGRKTKTRRNCPVACASASDWRAQLFTSRKSCFTTNRRPASTRSWPTALIN